MIRVRCPDCGVRLEVDDEDLGQDVRCPSCRAVFAARAEGAPPPADEPRGRRDRDDEYDRPRRRRRRRDDYDDDPDEIVEDARRAVLMPGLFTILVCAAGIGLAALDLVLLLVNPKLVRQGMFAQQAWMTDELLIAIRIAAIAWESVILTGAVSMIRLRSYKFAQAAMAMRCLPFAGLCCIIGLAFGAWGMTVLNRPEVREGFELARADRDRAGRRGDRDWDEDGEDREELR